MTLDEAYRYLGLQSEASVEDVERAFRRISRTVHPDTGAARSAWDKLQQAREVALTAAPDNKALVPAAAVRELVRAHTQALERLEERLDTSQAVDSIVRRIARRHTDPVRQRKRVAQIGAIVAAAFAGLVALVGSMGQISPLLIVPADHPANTVVVITLAIAAASTGVAAAALSLRAQTLEHLLEDVKDLLGQRPVYLDLLDRLNRSDGLGRRWRAEALTQAIARSEAELPEDDGVLRRALAEIGPADLGRIVIVKGIDLGFLVEEAQREGDRFVVEYGFKPPGIAGTGL